MTEAVSNIRAQYIDFMGRALEEQGLSPIAGRMLGLLIFDGEARSFSELAEELGVSRGSISANARLLVNKGTIVKENRAGDRQDYFRIADESFEVMLTSLRERILDTARSVQGFAEALPGEQPARRRLCGMAEFYRAMAEGVSLAITRLSNLKP